MNKYNHLTLGTPVTMKHSVTQINNKKKGLDKIRFNRMKNIIAPSSSILKMQQLYDCNYNFSFEQNGYLHPSLYLRKNWSWEYSNIVLMAELGKNIIPSEEDVKGNQNNYYWSLKLNGIWHSGSIAFLISSLIYPNKEEGKRKVLAWIDENLNLNPIYKLLVWNPSKVIDFISCQKYQSIDYSRLLALRATPEEKIFEFLQAIGYTRNRVGMQYYELRMALHNKEDLHSYIERYNKTLYTDLSRISLITICSTVKTNYIDALNVSRELYLND